LIRKRHNLFVEPPEHPYRTCDQHFELAGVVLLPVRDIASVEASGEVLFITTLRKETHSITYRLKDLESRLDPSQFVRLSRGALVRIELITRVTAMPGGTYIVTLKNDQRLAVSRIQSRILRDQLLRL